MIIGIYNTYTLTLTYCITTPIVLLRKNLMMIKFYRNIVNTNTTVINRRLMVSKDISFTHKIYPLPNFDHVSLVTTMFSH